jgi:HK97 gp10 family phage protein
MAGISIKLQGLESSIRKLRVYQIDKKARVREVIATVGLLIESEAKQNAPVDTGRLRASIRFEMAPNGLGGEVATNVTYAPYLELGTRNRPARPFLFPAVEKYRNTYRALLLDALRTR